VQGALQRRAILVVQTRSYVRARSYSLLIDTCLLAQEDLLAGKLYDMLGVDDRYDAATEQFIRGAVADGKPFFFYFASHHTVRHHLK
jgi:hypothetical protein